MPRLLFVVGIAVLGGCDDDYFTPCAELSPTWHGVQCTLNTHCISCHGEQHLLDGATRTVTVLPADVLRDLTRGTGNLVRPGDPDNSLLWRSLAGTTQPSDGQYWGVMPYGYDAPLPASQIDHVRQWIADGAVVDGRELIEDTDTDTGGL